MLVGTNVINTMNDTIDYAKYLKPVHISEAITIAAISIAARYFRAADDGPHYLLIFENGVIMYSYDFVITNHTGPSEVASLLVGVLAHASGFTIQPEDRCTLVS